MALAEARAAWQRTANRCLVQEDAKRAPKLACCPSATTHSIKHPETEPVNPDNCQDIPTTSSLPFTRNPSCFSVSPTSRWWLQTQPNYGYHQLMASGETQNLELLKEGSGKTDDPPIVGGCDVSKSTDDVVFESKKNAPWWQTVDTEELALLVAQRSANSLENCDLPTPQTARIKKDVGIDMCYFNADELSNSLLAHKARKACLGTGYCCPKHGKSGEGQSVLDSDRLSRDGPTHKKTPVSDTTRSHLLEALRHSQTRAREAEEVMKRACTEKEHVVKLMLRQASQIFAYKQWVHLLQLENTCSRFKKHAVPPPATTSPNWAASRKRKMQKSGGWLKCSNGKWAKRARAGFDIGRFAIVFALGLGIVGAGLLLGWTIGWVLPDMVNGI